MQVESAFPADGEAFELVQQGDEGHDEISVLVYSGLLLAEDAGVLRTFAEKALLYTSDGECRQEFSVVFTARAEGGNPTPSDETRSVEWVSPERVKSLQMDRSMRLRIEHYLDRKDRPYLG